MHPYYHKLNLDLSFEDWRFLNYLYVTYSNNATPFKHMDHVSDFYKDLFLRSIDNSYKDNDFFKKLANLFVDGCEYNSVDWIYNHSQISIIANRLPVHYDRRSCAISIPMLPMVTPVNWYNSRDENDVACEYYYDSLATLVNTKLFHGAPNNEHKRIFFQVGGFTEDFTDVIKLLR